MTSKHRNQFATFIEDFFNLSKSMVAYLKPLVDHKSAKTEWGILNDQPCMFSTCIPENIVNHQSMISFSQNPAPTIGLI